ncbi:MAG: CdaR family protein [Croceivirga sp.]
MSPLKSLFENVNSRKAKVFLIFLLCSFFAWTISKLSEEYESQVKFEVAYRNIPDSLLAKKEVVPIESKIRASGFQLLSYTLNTKTIRLSLKKVLEQDGTYFLTENELKNQIERQLPNSVSLIDLSNPIYYTNLYLVDTKRVPVVAKLDLTLAQNYLLKGKLLVEPDSILIKGPQRLISTINNMATIPFVLENISSDFSNNVSIQKLDSLSELVISPSMVNVSGKIVRFSEKEFDVSIGTRNVPEGYRLKMFPDHVHLYCKADVDRLKELKPNDFGLFVDFSAIEEGKFLSVHIDENPKDVFSVRLLQNRIEFVLEKI